jgi:hypothetical protein
LSHTLRVLKRVDIGQKHLNKMKDLIESGKIATNQDVRNCFCILFTFFSLQNGKVKRGRKVWNMERLIQAFCMCFSYCIFYLFKAVKQFFFRKQK